jgi:hypothetical protein
MHFRNAQRQLPEIWIMYNGAVSVRQAKIRFNLRSDEAAANLLNNLVKQGRLVTREIDGKLKYDVPRRSPAREHTGD